MTEANDLRRAKAGDREALGRLLDRHEPELRRRLEPKVRVLSRKLGVSDVIQSSFLQVIRHFSSFRGESETEFAAWLWRVLENRLKYRQRFYGAEKREGDVPRPPPPNLPSPSSGLSRGEDLRILAESLDALPEDQREVLLLKVADGLSHDAIAERLSRSPGATRMLLSRARAALALEIERREGS